VRLTERSLGPPANRRNDRLFYEGFIVLFLTISAGVSSVCANLAMAVTELTIHGNLIERQLLDDGTVSPLP
jgi:hypothetical protein